MLISYEPDVFNYDNHRHFFVFCAGSLPASVSISFCSSNAHGEDSVSFGCDGNHSASSASTAPATATVALVSVPHLAQESIGCSGTGRSVRNSCQRQRSAQVGQHTSDKSLRWRHLCLPHHQRRGTNRRGTENFASQKTTRCRADAERERANFQETTQDVALVKRARQRLNDGGEPMVQLSWRRNC